MCYSMGAEAEGPTCRKGDLDVKGIKNAEIEKQVKRRIKKLGYGKRLMMDPIPNTFKRRNHFTKTANGTCVFTAFMWQLNSLEGKRT